MKVFSDRGLRIADLWAQIVCIFLLFSTVAVAAPDPALLCDRAAQSAARQTGVPVEILRAISRVETGRRAGGVVSPWPWAVNQAGQGHWFSDASEAIDFINEALSDGSTNLDIGCFQLNYRWHSHRFSSVEEMFDPETNAFQAAQFLTELKAEGMDWRGAVAAYHSRNPIPAQSYLASFDVQFGAPPQIEVEARENRFPLFLAGMQGGAGSLVPMIARGNRLVADPLEDRP